MKKLLSAIIALLLCISIVACDSGKNTDNNPNKENGNKTEETTTGNGNVNTPPVSGSENVNTPPVSGSEGENNGNEETPDKTPENLAEIYIKYPNLFQIGAFYNGLASFHVFN